MKVAVGIGKTSSTRDLLVPDVGGKSPESCIGKNLGLALAKSSKIQRKGG